MTKEHYNTLYPNGSDFFTDLQFKALDTDSDGSIGKYDINLS